MWKNFEGKARTREESAAYLATLRWIDWKPEGITLHNTAAPSLKQWAESGAAHDARIRNLQNYYEKQLGWHAGPHFFVSRNYINWFSNPRLPGVHSRCWNATRFGIEMVGDYNVEEFNSGDGVLVRDNAVYLIALLNNRFGLQAGDLTFHKECKRDNHDCPGHKVVKADVIVRVRAKMAELAGQPVTPVQPAAPVVAMPIASAPAARKALFSVRGKMSTFGGPRDTGMKPDEGLALFQTAGQMTLHRLGDFLLPQTQFSGLGRRLNPEKPYLACRWPTARYEFLRDAIAWVSNPKNGKSLPFRPVDWGPNARTGRVTDLSPGGARDLGLQTDDECVVTVYEDGR